MIEVRSLKKYFPIKRGILRKTVGFVKAVDDISFSIREGQTYGLVGESGCGKTTTGRLLLRLLAPDSGTVIYNGNNILNFTKERLRRLRREMQVIFQDPFSSLNPRMNVRDIVSEGLLLHENMTRAEVEKRCDRALEMVGLQSRCKWRYPHQFSGGERQRIGIARAIIMEPKFIVCDEPVSSLDVSIQAKILKLLKDLKKTLNLTYLFIAHDLSIVANMCERLAIMLNGKIVEEGPTDTVYMKPSHPYTKKLLKSIPVPDPRSRK